MGKLEAIHSKLGTLMSSHSSDETEAKTVGGSYTDGQLIEVPLTLIDPNPDQPRKSFSDEGLADLAASIRKDGVLQPVVVTTSPDPERFILVAGERRLRASTLAERETIPVIFKQHVDLLELALIENLQREGLNPIEEAEALSSLRERHGHTDGSLAAVLGKSRVAVNETLALSRLPASIRNECRARDTLSKRHLLLLSRVESPEEQSTLWEKFKRDEPSTREAEKLTREATGRAREPKPKVVFSTVYGSVIVQSKAGSLSPTQVRDALAEALAEASS